MFKHFLFIFQMVEVERWLVLQDPGVHLRLLDLTGCDITWGPEKLRVLWYSECEERDPLLNM